MVKNILPCLFDRRGNHKEEEQNMYCLNFIQHSFRAIKLPSRTNILCPRLQSLRQLAQSGFHGKKICIWDKARKLLQHLQMILIRATKVIKVLDLNHVGAKLHNSIPSFQLCPWNCCINRCNTKLWRKCAALGIRKYQITNISGTAGLMID